MALIHVARLHQAIIAGDVAIVGVDANGIVSPSNLQTAAQSIIDAFDDSDAAQLSFENTQARAEAGNAIDNNKDEEHKLIRAIAAVIIDELNVLREWDVSFKVEVAAATSLADLKTRVATLPDLSDRTLAQAVTAIKNKINAGTVD